MQMMGRLICHSDDFGGLWGVSNSDEKPLEGLIKEVK